MNFHEGVGTNADAMLMLSIKPCSLKLLDACSAGHSCSKEPLGRWCASLCFPLHSSLPGWLSVRLAGGEPWLGTSDQLGDQVVCSIQFQETGGRRLVCSTGLLLLH